MNNVVFNYNQEQASKVGGGASYNSGGYDVKIARAQFKENKFLELDLEAKEGQKFNYISINYTKNDGQPNDYGHSIIQAIMGCVGVAQLSCDQNGNIPELNGKFLKAVLQRIDYTKQSGANAGKDAFRFDFKLPAFIKTGQTVKEFLGQKPAEAFERYAESIEDKDERGQQQAQHPQSAQQRPQNTQQPQQQYNEPPMDFDDDIPF